MIIGIVGRDEDINGTKLQVITKNNLKYLHHKVSYIGILSYDNEDDVDYSVLQLCDGIIIQGGSDIYPYHYQIVEYCMDHHIPLLGICMGHQIIGLCSSNLEEKDLIPVDNHYSKDDIHHISSVPGSFIHQVLGDEIYVNSRHLYRLNSVLDPFLISSYSDDGVIESIEFIDKDHFIVGVQWHPEDLDNMNDFYDCFLKEVLIRSKKSAVN